MDPRITNALGNIDRSLAIANRRHDKANDLAELAAINQMIETNATSPRRTPDHILRRRTELHDRLWPAPKE